MAIDKILVQLPTEVILNWLTFMAILVALFGERLWKYCDNRIKKKEIGAIIKQNLEQLQSKLLKIRIDTIAFGHAPSSEIDGYYFLFSDLLLPNVVQFKLRKYPKTIDFFIYYKINMETIRKNKEATMAGLTHEMVDKLLVRLGDAIKEFS